MKATAHSSWGNLVSVNAELPFLKIGASVDLEAPQCAERPGQIRWIDVHICPDTGVPRLNIGIELDPEQQVEVGDIFDATIRDVDEGVVDIQPFAK